MVPGIDWLHIDYRTLFLLTADGRIERENDPPGSPGPRFWLAGCPEGNICGVRADLPDDVTAALKSLTAAEPPFFTPTVPPKHLDRYAALLGRDAPLAGPTFGLIYELPHSLHYQSRARLIAGDSPEGHHLAHSVSAHGMPEGLSELGFCDIGDFWPPWCAAVTEGQIASIAFAARISEVGAELGLATAKAFRGRGFAAAATAGWSALPSLRSRTLFYSTQRENASSQQVAARLGLRLRGTSLRIP